MAEGARKRYAITVVLARRERAVGPGFRTELGLRPARDEAGGAAVPTVAPRFMRRHPRWTR